MRVAVPICSLFLICFLLLVTTPPSAVAAEGWQPELLERDLEIREALSAGPETIRDGAGVYVLTRDGYELARESSNGFHCVVGRSQPEAYEPQCFDAAGSATLLELTLLRGELQMQGAGADEIQKTIDEAWESGRLKAPQTPGINYMLSEKNRVPVGPARVIPYGPHLMFYAPNLDDEAVGGDPTGKASPVFMINQGLPSGYVIVPIRGH